MADVLLKGIKKSYGEVDVIKGVDIEIKHGEFVVFVGPSGCGKSTLLRMIAGLEDITGGTLEIGGRVVNEVQAKDRGIAMVFQSYAIFPHMTVRENVAFGLTIAKASKAEKEEKVAEAARILQMEHLLDRRPSQLSGGQRQRVAIGRAIVREPKVFLFDEPLSNLDAALRLDMRMEIGKLHKSLGATMVYVTHDQVEAMTLADKIVVLRAGNIEQVGAPLHLYNDPDQIFVAGFIGSPKMNFLKAEAVSSSNGTMTVTLPDFGGVTVPLPVKSDRPDQSNGLLLGIRPEHFAPSGGVGIEVNIDVIENLGGSSFAYARSAEEQPLIIELQDGQSASEGNALATCFDPARAFLFDASSGHRLR